jgi:hypothetical protein
VKLIRAISTLGAAESGPGVIAWNEQRHRYKLPCSIDCFFPPSIIEEASMDRARRRPSNRTPRPDRTRFDSLFSSPPIDGPANLAAAFFIFQRSVGLKFAVCNQAWVLKPDDQRPDCVRPARGAHSTEMTLMIARTISGKRWKSRALSRK